MQPLPPPSPDDIQPDPTATQSGPRRRRVIALAAASALGVGGVVIGAQLVSADDDSTEAAATPTTEADDETEPADAPSDEPTSDESPVDETPADEETPVDDGTEPGDDELPSLDDLGDLGTIFDDIGTCLSDELPEISDDMFGDDMFGDLDEFPTDGDWDGALDELLGGAVTVFDPADDSDGLLSFFDFGDGDGSITITQTDGVIEVETDGDVNEIDVTDLGPDLSFEIPEFELPEIDPEVGEAVEDCLPFLGDGGLLEIFDDIFAE